MTLPKRKIESGSNDLQSATLSIEQLARKFILPVDSIRSYASPGPYLSGEPNEEFKGIKIDNIRKLESRVHAFYRYIGFPVAVPDGFYNPGFNPGRQFLPDTQSLEKKKNINNKFNNSSFKQMVDRREEDHEINRQIFARQDLSSSVFALILRYVRPFKVMKDGLGPFEIDEQSFIEDARESEVDLFFLQNELLSKSSISFLAEVLGAKFNTNHHILKPFVVDPRIEAVVMPDLNKVAVPFLASSNDLKIDQNVSVQRPGIELIIRERLLGSSEETPIFLETLKKIINNDVSPNAFIEFEQLGVTVDTITLKKTVEALLGTDDLESANLDLLKGINSVQIKMVTELVRLLRFVLLKLKEAVLVIDAARNDINWVPIPSPEGPEVGPRGAILNRDKISNTLTELDTRIINLKIQKMEAERQITQANDLGGFASPFSITASNVSLDNSLQSITANLEAETLKRDKLADSAFKAMGDIELISGEVSGLGLVDILAIYIALWSMDEESLISLLDNDSFNRLTENFPDLVTGEAAVRSISGISQNISDALANFEKNLLTVLDFADREFAKQFSTFEDDNQ